MRTINLLGKKVGFKLSKQPYSSSRMEKPTEEEHLKSYLGLNLLQLNPSERILCIHIFWFHMYIGGV